MVTNFNVINYKKYQKLISFFFNQIINKKYKNISIGWLLVDNSMCKVNNPETVKTTNIK